MNSSAIVSAIGKTNTEQATTNVLDSNYTFLDSTYCGSNGGCEQQHSAAEAPNLLNLLIPGMPFP